MLIVFVNTLSRTAGVIVGTSQCTDIVQLGLGESTTSAVYTAAKYVLFVVVNNKVFKFKKLKLD